MGRVSLRELCQHTFINPVYSNIMRTGLSCGEILITMVIVALLCAPQAVAQLSDYSTDTGEPDIMMVKNDHCCRNAELKQAANTNIQLNVQHAFLAILKPIKIQVLDASNQEVAHISTRDRVIYMHLPEGRYTIKVTAWLDHKSVTVDASDAMLKRYIL